MAGSRTTRVLRKTPAVLRRDLELRKQALGSEGEHYLAFVANFLETLQPEDLIESMLVGQAADHAWHISRLRQIETALLPPPRTPSQPSPSVNAAFEELSIKIGPTLHRELLIGQHGFRNNAEYHALKEKFEPAMREQEERLRKEAQLRAQTAPQQVAAQASTPESLAAAYVANSSHLEKISRGIVLAESRFAAALKELERYGSARRLQAKSEAPPILEPFRKEVECVESLMIPSWAPDVERGASCGSRSIARQRIGGGCATRAT